MARTIKKLAAIVAAAWIILPAAGCHKEAYKISEQTPADYISWQRDASDEVTYSAEGCELPPARSGSAYDYLRAITSVPHRRAGTAEYRCAAAYLREVLESFGYEVTELVHPFPYYSFKEDEVTLTRLRDGKKFDVYPVHYSAAMYGPRRGVVKKPWGKMTGAFVYVGSGPLGRSGSVRDKLEGWKQKGAIGVILEADMRPMAAKGLVHSARAHATSWHYSPLPAFVVAGAGDLVGEAVEITQRARIVKGQGINVVARGPGPPKVLVTAHLDSWFNGALDDGSGVAAMLEVAELMKDDPRGLVFLAADAEELGLIGSANYMMRHGGDLPAAVVELDMVSSLNNFSADPPQEAGIMPRVITSSRGMKPYARDNLDAMAGGKYYLSVAFMRRVFGMLATDMEWFYAAGVPGVFIYTPGKYYHTRLDTIEWVPEAGLQETAEATARLVRDLRHKADALPVPEKVIPLEFEAGIKGGDTVSFVVRTGNDDASHNPGNPKVNLRCYFENGFEDTVKMEHDREKDAWIGEWVPPWPGEWQYLAVAGGGGRVGKRWISLASPPEKE